MRSCPSACQAGHKIMMPCLSSGRVSDKKGNEVTQMPVRGRWAPWLPLHQELPGSTEVTHPHLQPTPPFSQTLKLGLSFRDYDAHVWQRHKVWNICKHGKILWRQTLPINHTWPLYLWYPKVSHLTMKARTSVCVGQ